jgi:hypothetical protein
MSTSVESDEPKYHKMWSPVYGTKKFSMPISFSSIFKSWIEHLEATAEQQMVSRMANFNYYLRMFCTFNSPLATLGARNLKVMQLSILYEYARARPTSEKRL